MIVRISLWPNTDLDVDEREAANLRSLGLLIEPAPVEPASPPPLQADTPPTPPRRPRRRGSAPVRGADS